ncbi:MAG: beta/gamma crystallin-related protein [Rhodoferax sp.]
MKKIKQTALAIAVLTVAVQAHANVTFYEDQNFQGRSFNTEKKVNDLGRFGYNDRASSVTVTNERWEVCEDAGFRGQCVVLRPGNYPTLASLGLNNRVSSARAIKNKQRVDDRRYAPAAPPAQITFYEKESFGGRSFTTDTLIENFRNQGFNDRVSSVMVAGPDQWEACEDDRFNGRCVVLRPGHYPSLRGTGLNDRISSVRNTSVKTPANTSPSGKEQIIFFENPDFSGRSFSTVQRVDNLTTSGFNDRASSLVVVGDSRWEVCEDARFNGQCRVLRQGQYPSLTAMGLNNRISSVREISREARIDDQRYAPLPVAAPDYRQRPNERLYDATVTSVRAVMGTPEKRCWMEREQVPQDQSSANVPAAVVGALLGGILGHQVGGGTGKDLATAGGAIAGAVLGSRVGGNAGTPQTAPQDVQRCEETPPQAQTEYWEVTYNFRGEDHRIQMTSPPGRTITVNAQGEPRS